MKRNLVIYGNIYTADKKNPGAAALAISEGKFAYVGDEEGVKEYSGKDTEVIRFDKGIILPGFGEGHGHITPGGTEKLFFVHLKHTDTLQQHLSAIKEFIEEHPELEGYSGLGLRPHTGYGTKRSDRRSPERPDRQTDCSCGFRSSFLLGESCGNGISGN